MGLRSFFSRMFAVTPAPEKAASSPGITARFDNSLTTPENQRNWWATDFLSARAANSYQVRRILRLRSRYEASNNPYLWGVCNDNAKDLVDTGPTLQVLSSDEAFKRKIETAWREWAAEVNLAEKLKICKLAKTVDGEGFLILKTVPELENPVKLYPVDIEADQVTTPTPTNMSEMLVDGLDLSPVTGRPVAYHVLKYHPGDFWFPDMNPLAVERVPAKHVIHWMGGLLRPGTVRGIPVFASSLDLFTELRSFRKSTVDAAQTAANHAAVVTAKDAPPGMDDDDTDQEDYRFKRVSINRNMMTFLPGGWDLKQFEAKHPSTTYDMFQEACLKEAIRPLSFPLLAALGTSQKANFSSARLDFTQYRHGLRVERKTECEPLVLEKIFRAFVEEACRIPGLLPAGVKSAADVPHAWHWPDFETLDPLVDAQADSLRLAAGMETWQAFCARRGVDWMDHFRALSKAQKELVALDINIGEPVKRTVTDKTDEDPEQARASVQALMRRAWERAERSLAEYERLAASAF